MPGAISAVNVLSLFFYTVKAREARERMDPGLWLILTAEFHLPSM